MSEVATFPLPESEMAGVIVVNAFAILSAAALFSVAVRMSWVALSYRFRETMDQPREYAFFNTQLGYYAACLLIANMFNSAAGLMGLPVVFQRALKEDMLCSAQATVMQFGNASTAYFTCAIALHTFNSLVIRKRQSILVNILAIVMGWILSGVIASLPLYLPRPSGEIYGISGLSCGVRDIYPKSMFLFHLLPIFITALLSALLYSLIFLVLRGTLVVRGGFKLQLDPDDRRSVRLNDYQRFVAAIARSMLWYPVAYVALLVPYSVTRLLALSGMEVPFEVMIFAFTCWFMLGVVNVLLLYNTFRVLYPAFHALTSGVTNKDIETLPASVNYNKGTSSYPQSNVDEKTDHYRFPPSSVSESKKLTVRNNLPAYPERSASVQSYYSYPSSTSSIGRPIAPVSVLNRSIDLNRSSTTSPEPSPRIRALTPSLHRQSPVDHSRDGSMDSLISLPAPPRRTRAPQRPRRPHPESLMVSPTPEDGRWVIVPPAAGGSFSPVSRGEPVSTYQGGATSRESAISESSVDITGWLSRQKSDGSMPHGLKNMPLLSAVTSSFPTVDATSSPRRQQYLPSSPGSERSLPTGPGQHRRGASRGSGGSRGSTF